MGIAFLILLVAVDLILTVVLVHRILVKVENIDFKADRIEVIYRTANMIESSCDGMKVLLRSMPRDTSRETLRLVKNDLQEVLKPPDIVEKPSPVSCEFENDIKNIMSYSPSPKKRQEIKRRAGENN